MSMATNYKLYWQGKTPRVRAATEDFILSGKPVKEIALKHGVSIVAISNNAKRLRYLDRKRHIDLVAALVTQHETK